MVKRRLADPAFDCGNTEAITETVRNQLQSNNFSVDKLVSLVSDGVAVMVDKKSDVSTRLKEDNPQLITNHWLYIGLQRKVFSKVNDNNKDDNNKISFYILGG